MALISRSAKLWPGGVVPFDIDQDMDQSQKDAITAGIALVANACPGVTFVSRATEPNWLHFIVYFDPTGLGSDSRVGMQHGPQFIWLSSGIRLGRSEGTIAHEICHTLGLLHEQNRSDRNSFVTINWGNIGTIHQDQFKARPSESAADFGAYDKTSIMHYQRRSYAIDSTTDTITPLTTPPALSTGTPPTSDFSRSSPSTGDVAAINSLYPPSAPFGESSDTGPALAHQGGKLLLAWKGEGNTGLSTMTSTSDNTSTATNANIFSSKRTLNGESSTNAPALGMLNANFVMAWTGEGNNQLNVMQSSDGSSWHSKVTLGDTSPSPPALAQLGPEIFLAWRGGDNRLNLLRSFDGIHWGQKQTIGETTESGPALSVTGPKLLLVWRGRGNNSINVISATGGVIAGFGGIPPLGFSKTTLADTTDDRPAICMNGKDVYLAWRGTGNGFMNVMKSGNGQTWSGKIIAGTERLRGGPAITAWSNVLVRAWTDFDSRKLRSRAFQAF